MCCRTFASAWRSHVISGFHTASLESVRFGWCLVRVFGFGMLFCSRRRSFTRGPKGTGPFPKAKMQSHSRSRCERFFVFRRIKSDEEGAAEVRRRGPNEKNTRCTGRDCVSVTKTMPSAADHANTCEIVGFDERFQKTRGRWSRP